MLVVTESLTIGQLTFILRVALQIITLAGPILIGLLILSNAPRLASFSTHDIINRVIGSLSANKVSARWVLAYLQRRTRDPIRSFRLPVSIALLVLYGLFSSLSDIGFLGLYSCSVPAPIITKLDSPGSINDPTSAKAAVVASFANGTDINTFQAYRCDSPKPITLSTTNGDRIARNCTAWRNSTWADPTLFFHINTTDSDALIPRSMAKHETDLTSFFVDSGRKRVEIPTIKGGILVNPNDIGFQAIFGVPQLKPDQEFTLDKVMALEVETGCMSLGIGASQDSGGFGSGMDTFRTNGTWRRYSGPEILFDVLSNATDAIREYWRPVFNVSTLSPEGSMTAENTTTTTFSNFVTVQRVHPPESAGSLNDAEEWLIGNCTNSVRQKFGLPAFNASENMGSSCSLLGLNGPGEVEGFIFGAQNQMVCATISQINMVAVTVSTNSQGSISLKTARLPSDLNHLVADGWDLVQVGNETLYSAAEPIERWTLSDSSDGNGPTSHYISHGFFSVLDSRVNGLASGGYALSRAGPRMIQLDSGIGSASAGLEQIGGADFQTILDPKVLTRWSGQVGASFILSSLQYNPWASLTQKSISVTTRGTELAICYHPPYALGFLPLILAAMLVGSWFIGILVSTSFRRLRYLGDLYGGMYPYWKSVCPNLRMDDIFLVWRKEPDPRLDVSLSNEDKLGGRKGVPKAADYLASAPPEHDSELDLRQSDNGRKYTHN